MYYTVILLLKLATRLGKMIVLNVRVITRLTGCIVSITNVLVHFQGHGSCLLVYYVTTRIF